MTRLVQPPLEIEMLLGPEGAPSRIGSGPLEGSLEPVGRWLAELDWWRQPVAREYWKVILGGRLLCEVFHDLSCDAWFLERIYD